MNSETRNCQNCKEDFIIKPEDFLFYNKIKVPPPTFCPECRLVRRFTWRNERSLYRNKCAKTGKNVISIFSPESNITVYDRDEWWKDDWNPADFNQEYDFSKPFFLQFRELLKKTPMPALFTARTTNCSYCNHIGEMKNCYLTYGSWMGENLLYTTRAAFSKDCCDVLVVDNAEFSYYTFNATKIFKVFYSEEVENCTDCYFLYDSKGCTNCFMSTNLRNKSYCIRNVQYSKEEYFKKMDEYDLGKRSVIQKLKGEFKERKQKAFHKFARITNAPNCTGDNIRDSFNCKECFDVFDKVKDSKWAIHGGFNIQDCYDCYGMGANAELLYESIDVGDSGQNYIGVIVTWVGVNVSYCINCHGCTDCFGCIGLKKKQYCIFNKQYTKEEYEKLVPRIKQHMSDMSYTDTKGNLHVFGDFFPTELSPFAYNETIAQDYFPLSKDSAGEKGYSWHVDTKKEYIPTINFDSIPESIDTVEDSIIGEVIECAHNENPCKGHQCTTAFRITQDELIFYKRLHIPIPDLCPNCRHHERLLERNPMKLWHRQCMCILENHDHQGTCSNEFETSYSPKRSEKVFCEFCYQKEVL